MRNIALVPFVTLLAIPALPSSASGQTATTTPAQAFLHAVQKVCAPNAMGKLSVAAPSAALDAAHVLLVDGSSDPGTRGAFHDMPATIDYGAIASTGQITIGADEAGTCRVAATDVSPADVVAIQAAMRGISGDSNPISSDAAGGQTTYSGTVGGEAGLMIEATVPPAGSHWGHAGIVVTVMNPAAPG